MKISTVLDHIDSGHMALPEFQRGYVWNRDQVRGLFDSLYRRHPVGGLLVWATEAHTTEHRGDGPVASGIVKLLLDGQQRMTSIYGVVRGHSPKFFEGNADTFTGLRFHLATEVFQFYQPITMRDDALWIDVSSLMKAGTAGIGPLVKSLTDNLEQVSDLGDFVGRLSQLLAIVDVDLHVEEVTGADKTLDVVVEIFNKVNSGGTKLSKGDLALAKICAEWPEARAAMRARLKDWSEAGFSFTLDWLLRSVNTVLTGEAKFSFLHDAAALDIQDGLSRAAKHIDKCLNMISGRLGLDHDRVLFGRYAIPIMVRYLDQMKGVLSATDRDRLLFWFVQAGMWGRFSGSTETFIDQDLEALDSAAGPIDGLLERLRLWHGGLRVEPAHFTGWSLGARFYPVLYMLTRMGQGKDLGTGLPLQASLLGKMSALEVHHIFAKAQLYKFNYARSEVNAVANFCFLTKDTNLRILDRRPEDYFEEVEANHPGSLATQWIPMDKSLWRMDRYPDFLEARKSLLAEEANRRFADLLHGDDRWIAVAAPPAPPAPVIGGVTSEAEETELEAVNEWLIQQGLSPGQLSYDHADPMSGAQLAVFDLAWPDGLQSGLGGPVAVLLDEPAEVLAAASAAGFRYFTSSSAFKAFVQREVLRLEDLAA